MRRGCVILLLLVATSLVRAEQRDWLREGLDIPDITVTARRPMRDIGVEQTKIDSALLHQNISFA